MLFPSAGTIETRIKRLFYFRLLTEAQLAALVPLCKILKLEEGQLVFSEGDAAQTFFIVLSGKIQIYKISREGKEMILHLFGPGELFAEVPIFSEIPTYPANALCVQNAEVLQVEGEGFRQLVSQYPDMALNMLGVFAQRLHKFSELIEDLSLRTVESRLAKYLLSVSENSPDKAVINIHKKTLASILGTIPETLSRTFKKLSTDGLVKMEGHRIHLLNRSALETLAE